MCHCIESLALFHENLLADTDVALEDFPPEGASTMRTGLKRLGIHVL